MKNPNRHPARQQFLDMIVHAAAVADRRGESVRYAATNASLPGPFGRQYPNNAKCSFAERLLRTRYDDYSHFRPRGGMVAPADRWRASAYINPRYVGAGARLAEFVRTGDTSTLTKGLPS